MCSVYPDCINIQTHAQIYIQVCVYVYIYAVGLWIAQWQRRGYQMLCEPFWLAVKPFHQVTEATAILQYKWMPSMQVWGQWVISNVDKLFVLGVFCSLAGEHQGEALTKRAKPKSKLVGRKAPRCLGHLCGKVRMLKPRKIGTKCELAARLSLGSGWPLVVLQSSSHQRHFQLKAGVCHAPPGTSHRKGPGGRRCLPAWLLCEPGETGVQDGSCGQPQSHLLDHNPTPCSLQPMDPIWYQGF